MEKKRLSQRLYRNFSFNNISAYITVVLASDCWSAKKRLVKCPEAQFSNLNSTRGYCMHRWAKYLKNLETSVHI